MSDDSFWAGAAIAGVIAIGLHYYNKEDIKPPPPIGRYQVITHNNNAYRDFLLDTATGETWRFVYTPAKIKGDPDIWYWEKTAKVDSF